jgi:hypothetical protein
MYAERQTQKLLNFYNVVGQFRDDCRVGFQFLYCLAGRNQSFGDGFRHHPTMQCLRDDRGSDVRFHLTARNAAEKSVQSSRLVAEVIYKNIGVNEHNVTRWQGINIHTTPRLQQAR